MSYLTPATVNVVGGTSKITAVPTPSSAQLYIEMNLWALLGYLRFYLNADKMRGGERSFTCSDSTIHKSLDNILSLPIIRSCTRSERVDWKRVKAGLKQYRGTGHQSQSHRSLASHVHRIRVGNAAASFSGFDIVVPWPTVRFEEEIGERRCSKPVSSNTHTTSSCAPPDCASFGSAACLARQC